MAVKIPNDAIGTVPLIFDDEAGHNLAGGLTNVSAAVEDPTIATCALTSDGQWVQITPSVAGGASRVIYTDADDNITCALDFSIVAPRPVGASFNEAGMVLTPNPNPPPGAVGGPPVDSGTSTVTGGTGTDTTGGATGTDTTGGATGTDTTSGAGVDTTGGATAGTDTTGGAGTDTTGGASVTAAAARGTFTPTPAASARR